MKNVPTFAATIYVGFKHRKSGLSFSIEDAERVVQKYVDRVGLCVTVTPTKFIYTNGHEDGCAVGLINYPRFPSNVKAIRRHAIQLARLLKSALKQLRVSIVMPDETIMLEVA